LPKDKDPGVLQNEEKKKERHQKKKENRDLDHLAVSAVEISAASATKILAVSTTEIPRERDNDAAPLLPPAHQSLDSAKFQQFSALLLKDKDPGAGAVQKEEEEKKMRLLKKKKKKKKKKKSDNKAALSPLASQTTDVAQNSESYA
jgi:hypothetical protein